MEKIMQVSGSEDGRSSIWLAQSCSHTGVGILGASRITSLKRPLLDDLHRHIVALAPGMAEEPCSFNGGSRLHCPCSRPRH